MRFGILALQMVGRDMRIDLCRRQALMSQKFSDGLQIRSPVEQMRGKTVAQYMRGAFLLVTDDAHMVVNDVVHTAP